MIWQGKFEGEGRRVCVKLEIHTLSGQSRTENKAFRSELPIGIGTGTGPVWQWRVASGEWQVTSDDPSRECASISSNQLDHHAPSDHGRRALQAGKRDVAFRTKQAVNLRAAGLEQFGHLVFGYFPFPHGRVELPRHDFLDRLCLRLFKNALFLQKIINA